MSTRKSLTWSFSQEGIQKAVRFSGSIVIARLLTPDEVGVFSIAMAAAFLLNSIQDFGVGTYLVQQYQITKNKIRTVFGISLTIQWGLGLLLIMLKTPLANFYEEPGIAKVLSVIAISFFVGPFGQPALALLRRDMRFDILHHIAVAGVVVGTAMTIILAALGFSYMSMAWGFLSGNVVRAGLALTVRRDHLRLVPGYGHWKEVIQFGGWLTTASLVMTATTEGTKFVLGGLLTPGSVALFERSNQIPQMARQTLFLPVGRVLIPSFSKNIREGVDIGPYVETYISALTAILWPISVVLSLLSVPITLFLFGESWRVAGEIMPYIIFGVAIRAFLPTPNEILIPYGRVIRLTILRVFQFCMTIGLSIIGALHSLEMFAIMQVGIGAIFIIANYLTIRKFLGTSIFRLIGVYLKASMIALLSAIPSLVGYILYGEEMEVFVALVCCIAAGPLWLIGIYVSSHPLSAEASNAVKVLLKNRVKRSS